MTPKSYKPVPKVMNGGIAGAIAALLIWFLGESGYTVTPEAASLITLLAYFGAAYMTSPAPPAPPAPPDRPVEMWAVVKDKEEPVEDHEWQRFEEEDEKDA